MVRVNTSHFITFEFIHSYRKGRYVVLAFAKLYVVEIGEYDLMKLQLLLEIQTQLMNLAWL